MGIGKPFLRVASIYERSYYRCISHSHMHKMSATCMSHAYMCVHCTDTHMHAHTERTLKVHTLLPDTENNASIVQKGNKKKRQLRDLGYGNAKLLVYD